MSDRPEPKRSRSSTLLAIAVALLSGVFFLSHAHTGLYGDGPLFIELWSNGVWVQAHFLLLPLAGLLTRLASPLIDLGKDQAIIAVSVMGAALTCAQCFRVLAPRLGLPAALACVALLALAPALRFYAGAVEVHALAAGTSTVAMVLAYRRARSGMRGLLGTSLGYMLVCASHITLTLLGPALLLIHVDAERRAGRGMSVRRFLGSGAFMLLGAGIVLALIVVLDRLFIPERFATYSAVEQYAKAMAAWDSTIWRPAPAHIFVAEVLLPFGPLPILALCGMPFLWRRRAWLAAGLSLAVVAMVVCVLKVGAREYGAYMLPALPALACFAACAIHRWTSRALLAPWLLLALAVVLGYLGLASWWGEYHRGVDGPSLLGRWGLSLQELPVPFAESILGSHALGATWLWLSLAGAAALAAGVYGELAGRAVAHRSSPVAAASIALAGLVLLSWSAGERFRERWPALCSQTLREICDAAREHLGERDLLVTYCPVLEGRWTVNYYYGRPWVDLSQLNSDLSAEYAERWIRESERQMREVRAAGGRVVLMDDILVPGLIADPQHYAPAILARHRWLQEGLAESWTGMEISKKR